MSNLEVSLYRYNPETDKFPYMKTYEIEKPARDIMVLDLLHLLKEGTSQYLTEGHAEKVFADLME